MKGIKLILATFILFLASALVAQSVSVELSKTFEIHSKNPKENLKKYYDAASQKSPHDVCDLDRYRFYEKRRRIEFTGSDDYIELYSAKELNEKYGKPISPFTIREGQPYQKITFVINLDGIGLKPQML